MGKEMLVSWRAVIFAEKETQSICGQLSKIGKDRAVVSVERNVLPGSRCTLSVSLPKPGEDGKTQYLEAQGIVAISVQRAMTFHLTLRQLELKHDGESLLNDYLRKV